MKNTLTHIVYYEKTIFDGMLEKWDRDPGIGPRTQDPVVGLWDGILG